MFWTATICLCILLVFLVFPTNGLAVFMTAKFFDLRKTIFFSVFLDCLVSLACSSVVLVAFFLILFGYDLSLSCKLLFASAFFMQYLGGLLTALIAALRCHTMARSQSQADPALERTYRLAAGGVVLLLGVLPSAWIFGSETSNSESFSFLEDACQKRDAEINLHRSRILFMGPSLMIPPIVSLVLDALLIRKTRATVPLSEEAITHSAGLNCDRNRIPVQATIFSAVVIGSNLLFLSMKVVLQLADVGLETIGNILVILLCIFCPARAPLTLACSFTLIKAESRRTAMELNKLQRQERVRRYAWRSLKRSKHITVIV